VKKYWDLKGLSVFINSLAKIHCYCLRKTPYYDIFQVPVIGYIFLFSDNFTSFNTQNLDISMSKHVKTYKANDPIINGKNFFEWKP